MLRWKDKLITTGADKGKIFRNSGAYFLLGLSVIAMTFFGICAPKDGNFSISGNAAKVGSEKVTPQEFQRAYNNLRERMQAQYQENFDPIAMQLPSYVMRQLVDDRVAYQAALTAGVEAQEDDVIKLLQDAKAFQDEKGAFNAESFARYLRANGYTEASFSAELRRSITVQNFRQFVSKASYVSSRAAALDYRLSETKIDVDYVKIDPSMVKISFTDDDVKKFLDDAGKAKVKQYYDSHASEFNTKERAKARHILVSYSGAKSAAGAGALRTKEAAKKHAEEIATQVKAPGADFAKLASTLTDEASGKTRGGDLGYFTREDMVKEFSEAAFALSPGQISGVVESPFGFHIIKLDEKQSAKTVSVEQATPDIARKLLKEEKAPSILQKQAETLLADLKAGKSVDADLKELGAKWESSGPVPAGSSTLPGVGGERENVDAVLKLTKPGQFADKVLDNHGSKIIARLKSRVAADESKLDDAKKKELVSSASSSSGYALQTSYERSLRKELEAKGKIWQNPEYLSMGQRKSGGGDDQDSGG